MVVAPDILYWKMTPEKMDSYINLQPITFWVSFEKQVTAVNCMLCFLKMLKYLAIFPNIKVCTVPPPPSVCPVLIEPSSQTSRIVLKS